MWNGLRTFKRIKKSRQLCFLFFNRLSHLRFPLLRNKPYITVWLILNLILVLNKSKLASKGSSERKFLFILFISLIKHLDWVILNHTLPTWTVRLHIGLNNVVKRSYNLSQCNLWGLQEKQIRRRFLRCLSYYTSGMTNICNFACSDNTTTA